MLRKFLHPTNTKRILFFLFGDIALSFFSIYIAFLLRFNFAVPDVYWMGMGKMALVLVPLKIVSFYFFHLYFIVWRFFGFVEYKKLIYAHLVAYGAFSALFLFFSDFFLPFPRSVIGIDMFLSLTLLGFFRGSKRFFAYETKYHDKKALVCGANDKTIALIKSSKAQEIPYAIEAIIDENYAGNYFSDIKVYPKGEMARLIDRYGIDALLLAKELTQKELNELLRYAKSLGIEEIKKAAILQEDAAPKLKNISIEDLLARRPKDLDKAAIASFIKEKTVLITGAGGSIGSELARQCGVFGAKKILLLDNSEYNLYSIEQELQEYSIAALLKNIVDKESLQEVFATYRIDVVLHAAAYKHVPLCEENVDEAVKNNVLGTKNVIDLAIEYDVEKFVLISTDKAVRPTNVMGTTKRICELYAQNVPTRKTQIVAVRFGNVLGSSGSVIPKFQRQIASGGPLTVTHPEITRYFMLIPEACQLVLQAATLGKGGEVFVLDMGEPVKIADLARRMIELSGKEDIEILYTGLRKGEKLYEELLIDESDASTKYESIFVAKRTYYPIEKLQEDIDTLLETKHKRPQLQKIVPEAKLLPSK